MFRQQRQVDKLPLSIITNVSQEEHTLGHQQGVRGNWPDLQKSKCALSSHPHHSMFFFIADTQDVIFMIQLFPNSLFPWLRAKRTKLKRQVSKRAKRWNSERKRAPNFNFWCLIILEDIFSSGKKVGVITSRVLIFNFSSRKLLKMETSDLLPFLLSLRKSNQPRATFTETFKITSTVLIF